MAIVRWYSQSGGSRQPAALEPGELVWATIVNGLENPSATGKTRPVVLVEPRGSQWRVMGLTTNPRYRNGAPRMAIPDPGAVGLKRQGWLWGNRLCWTSTLDVGDHIGWVDEDLALKVVELAGLDGPTARDLLGAARKHHGLSIPLIPPLAKGGAG